MKRYNFSSIEKKWSGTWKAKKIYEPSLSSAKKPFYNLMMFPYPSAEGLHVGNMYAFTGSDIYGRFKRMRGYDVFEPIGLDGFGIHSENYAIKIGTHPMKQAKVSEKRFYKQLGIVGNGFAWNEHLETYDPEYYKWTQWIFVEMWKHGLAYRKKQPVNWCPSCKTVLADEQVIDGKCERCGTVVIKKELEQWFFKITKYAERLLQNLDTIDWSEKVKIAQRNWIGRSEGAEIAFKVPTRGVNCIIVHGSNASEEGSREGKPENLRHWKPWLKASLEKSGIEVSNDLYPEDWIPDYGKWKKVFEKNEINEDSILVGHSAGTAFLLRWLAENKRKVNKLILVAPSIIKSEKYLRLSGLKDFVFDASLKKYFNEVVLFYSDNDNKNIIRSVQEVHTKLGGKLINLKNNGHFTLKDMKTEEFPELLDVIVPKIKVFTTRPDTLFGATYMVLAPEHNLISNFKFQISNYDEVEQYVRKAEKKTEEQRIENKEKTGVELKGIKVINPANNEEIPVFVADYVLSGYGTGAIMAVPAHDERDFEFAKKFDMPIRAVISGGEKDELYEGSGVLMNSREFDGMDSEKAKWEITKLVGGVRTTQYRLRDWLISRQRYWGPPIPMIHCDACAAEGKGEQKGMPGWYAVPEKDLPVKLPFVKDFRPKGKDESPLASAKSFYEVRCPGCKGKARRETDVSDTFLDSAWYYLRYIDPKNKKEPLAASRAKRWLPVNMYIGGAEHSVLHLLYVRFVALALRDMKLLNLPSKTGEPFPLFRAHGLLIKDGAKMSKSKGNVVNPDEYIKKFGADAFRTYLMFLAPFEQGGDFRDQGILGITRFLDRIWKFKEALKGKFANKKDPSIEQLLHYTVKKVTEDIESLHYNTAISALMILFNKFEGAKSVTKEQYKMFLCLIAPFAPYLSEELWAETGEKKSIHRSPWPRYDARLIVAETFSLVVQVNGKHRATVEAERGINEDKARALALQHPAVNKIIGGKTPKKVVYVKDRLVNFVL